MKKTRFIVAAMAAFALVAFALVGCSSQGASSAASSSASSGSASSAASASGSSASGSASSGNFTLVVGFDNTYEPYGYIDDTGKNTGIDLDLAKEVCERNGWGYKEEAIDWDTKDALLNSGTINCIWNGFTLSDDRKGKYAWSEPYMHNAQVLVVKANSNVASLADLAGKHVMTQVDSSGLEALQSDEYAKTAATFAGGAPETLGDYNNIFMQLESGAVDAVVCDLSVAANQIAAKPGVFKQVEELSPESYAVGFKLGDEKLAAQVSDTLKKMYADGTVKTILDKYSDKGVSIDNWLLK